MKAVFSCKEASRLSAMALDARLTMGQRSALAMHLMICKACRLFRYQQGIIEKALRRFGKRDTKAEPSDAEALQRILKNLERELHRSDS